VSGDRVTANGQNQTASVEGRVPTAGLTNGGFNGRAAYTQLYLGLFSRIGKYQQLDACSAGSAKGYGSITFTEFAEHHCIAAQRRTSLGTPPALAEADFAGPTTIVASGFRRMHGTYVM
jgi:hypothetical protein